MNETTEMATLFFVLNTVIGVSWKFMALLAYVRTDSSTSATTMIWL